MRSDEKRTRRIPAWAWPVVVCLLLPAFALGGYWVNYKKPWLMDDYRAGYAAATRDADLRPVGNQEDPCAEAMAATYGGEARYVQYDTPEDQSAFYLGCWHGFHGVNSDWWNVSGYLTA